MKVTIEYQTNINKIIHIIEFMDFNENETLDEYKKRVIQVLDCGIQSTEKNK